MRDATHYAENADHYAEIAPGYFAQVPLDLTAGTGGDPVHAHANHGRWVVQCPDCTGAQLTHPADRRFLCNYCGNVGNARLFRPVVWPKAHATIGELLDERADHRLRNWSPGETVADLERENALLADGPVILEPVLPKGQCAPGEHAYPKTLPPEDEAAVCTRAKCRQTCRAGDIRAAREARS